MNKYLLDTNAIVAILEGDSSIQMLLVAPNETYVPVVAVAELYFGAEKSGRIEANIKRVDEFISRRTILKCDTQTARWYGRIEHQVRRKGKSIPQNDVWIAAIAMQHGLTVLTCDKHFDDVDGLAKQGW
ncbi:MAG: type II toxin-antitoxin system VapC family toxin [Chloroflexi bacterium]|nr:type II toxin-antitoxin system VapC family toxin [Chloroflexota bacterium]